MNNASYLDVQEAELLRLLEQAEDDPVLKPQILEMLEEIESAIKARPVVFNQIDIPRTAIFLRGGGVVDSEGIRPSLAGEALIQYEKMYRQQAIYDEQETAKEVGKSRRPRGAGDPELLFTGTPRGSFGLEFVPVSVPDRALQISRNASLETVTNSLNSVVGASEDNIDAAISAVPAAVLPPMKSFIKAIYKHGAELRLAYNNKPTVVYGSAQVQVAFERLDREIVETEETIKAIFNGLTFKSSRFDITTELGEIISGIISEEMPENERRLLYSREGQTFTFILRQTIVKSVSKPTTTSYVLLRAKD